MATLTIEVENKKLKFFKELINNLDFVHVKEVIEEDTKPEIIENLRESFNELKDVLEGKKEGIPFEKMIQELDEN